MYVINNMCAKHWYRNVWLIYESMKHIRENSTLFSIVDVTSPGGKFKCSFSNYWNFNNTNNYITTTNSKSLKNITGANPLWYDSQKIYLIIGIAIKRGSLNVALDQSARAFPESSRPAASKPWRESGPYSSSVWVYYIVLYPRHRCMCVSWTRRNTR